MNAGDLSPPADSANRGTSAGMARLGTLFEPFDVKNARLRNRFVVPSMQRGVSDDGAPPPTLADYYARFAEGGFGLIMSESCAIDHPSASRKASCVRMNSRTVGRWATCIQAVRTAGAPMLVQLWHEGALRLEQGDGVHPEAPTVSPSGIDGSGQAVGRALTLSDLGEITAAYVRSARLAQDAGAAGVELHAGHGFLLDQFLWAKTNRRTDAYGGARMIDRVRFPAEVVAAVRAATGKDFLISLRFSQWKGHHGRRQSGDVHEQARVADSVDDLAIMLRTLRAAGVDLFHASARNFDRPEWPDSPHSLAGWAKQVTDAPVIAVGSVGTALDVVQTLYEGRELSAAEAVAALEQNLHALAREFEAGSFDLIAVGRSSIGDQHWVNKLAAGRLSDIVPFERAMLASIVRNIR